MILRRTVLRGAAAAALIPSGWQMAAAAVRASSASPLRVWPADEYTRIVLASAKPIKATAWPVSAHRLVVDFEGIADSAALQHTLATSFRHTPYARSMAIKALAGGKLRATIVLSGDVKPDVFILRPTSRKEHRLIIDLYPAHPRDVIAEVLSSDEDEIVKHLTGMRESRKPAFQQPARPAAPDVRKPEKPKGTRHTPAGQPASQASARPQPARPAGRKRLIVAIDPGHGGEDPGASGHRGTQEKTVVLQIARELQQLIARRSDMKAFLTRRGDYFVPLARRADIAVRAGAHLFVSIHADAFTTPQASGSSVFILSEKGASSSGAQWLAQENNAADDEGGINLKHVKDRSARQALAGMIGDAQIRDSLRVGKQMLGHIALVNRPHSGRVERAGFRVLKSPVPSLLVETAFLSNPVEESRLRSAQFRHEMAQAILQGIESGWAAAPDLTA